MKKEDQRMRWDALIKDFNRNNRTRRTRLGQVKAGEVMEDYWLEDGLPLAGIDLDTDGKGGTTVEIMLGGDGATEVNMTHSVACVQKIRVQLTADGQGDSLEVEDSEGVTTLLRFETPSAVR